MAQCYNEYGELHTPGLRRVGSLPQIRVVGFSPVAESPVAGALAGKPTALVRGASIPSSPLSTLLSHSTSGDGFSNNIR
jgi:hypothetical protein